MEVFALIIELKKTIGRNKAVLIAYPLKLLRKDISPGISSIKERIVKDIYLEQATKIQSKVNSRLLKVGD